MTWYPVYSNGRLLFEFDPVLFRVRIKRNQKFYVASIPQLLLQTMAGYDIQKRPFNDHETHPDLHLDE